MHLNTMKIMIITKYCVIYGQKKDYAVLRTAHFDPINALYILQKAFLYLQNKIYKDTTNFAKTMLKQKKKQNAGLMGELFPIQHKPHRRLILYNFHVLNVYTCMTVSTYICHYVHEFISTKALLSMASYVNYSILCVIMPQNLSFFVPVQNCSQYIKMILQQSKTFTKK